MSQFRGLQKMKISSFSCVAVIFCATLLSSNSALADIYRCDKQAGVITLSNVEKGKNCTKMVLPPPEKRAPKAATVDSATSQSAAPIPDSKQTKTKSTYENAVSERKRIIQEEIDLEQERLDKATEKIATLTAIKKKSAAQEKELSSLQQKQNLFQSNISLLQKELNK